MLSVGELLDGGRNRRRMHQEYRLERQPSLRRFRTTATDVDADVISKTNDDSDGTNSYILTTTQIRTTYRITANIFQQPASTNTIDPSSLAKTENVPTIWSPLRISGMITLFFTIFVYVGLHFIASKQRQERKRKQRQRRSDIKQQIPPGRNNNNITSSDDPSQKSNETPIIQSQNPKLSTSKHGRMYTMIDVDGDDISAQKESSSSSTPSVVGDSSCISTDEHVHNQKGTTTTGDCSYLSIIPVVTTTTATLSSMVHSKNDNTSTNCSNIPNTILAKHKKRRRNHQYSSLNQNAHNFTPLDMNDHTGTGETSAVESSSFGLDQEQDIDQNKNNNNNVNRTTDTNVPQSPDAISGSASVDDDEVYFYEQTLQFNHHAQRENITLHIPISDTHDHINRNDTDESDVHNFVIPATSLWVSNEESFIHSV